MADRMVATIDLEKMGIGGAKLESSEIAKRNVRAVRAAVYGMSQVRKSELSKQEAPKSGSGTSAGEPKALGLDPFAKLTQDGRLVEPPLDMLTLAMIVENSTEVGPAIDAMTVNVESFGWKLQPRVPVDENTPGEIVKLLAQERAKAENFFGSCFPDGAFEDLREFVRRDLEATGNAYIEFIEVPGTSELDGLSHIPSWSMRVTPPDQESTPYTDLQIHKDIRMVEVEPERPDDMSGEPPEGLQLVRKRLKEEVSYSLREVTRFKRFRRYAQRRGNKVVWFKELGDPRVVSSKTGEVVTAREFMDSRDDWPSVPRFTLSGQNVVVRTGTRGFPVAHAANPVRHLRLYSTRSPYGLPRYTGHLFAIFGSRAADEINYTTFKNNNIPSMAVTVANGMLTDETCGRIQEFVESAIQSDDNYSKILVLEAEPSSEGLRDPGTMKIDIKPLTREQHTDALFVKYQENNDDRVRRAWRFPPIFVGKSDDFTGRTIEASRKLADEQVFTPERQRDDRFYTRDVLMRLGIIWSTFKTLSPNVTENADLIKLLPLAEKTGSMTPRLGREVLSVVMNRDLGEVDPDTMDPDKPFSLTLAELMKDRSSTQDGSGPTSQGRTGVATPSAGRDRSSEPAGTVESLAEMLRREVASRFGGFIPPAFEDDDGLDDEA